LLQGGGNINGLQTSADCFNALAMDAPFVIAVEQKRARALPCDSQPDFARVVDTTVLPERY
jgi:hypothetical protein